MAHIAGLVATGLHPSPIAHAHYTTTTTHKTLRGPRGGMILSSEEFGKTLNSQIFPGIQGGPLMHVIAAKAVAFAEALRPGFKDYQQQVILNAQALAKELTDAGFDLVSGGTDNHLMLVDLTSHDITGKDAEIGLDKGGITVNKNTVPFETRSPFVTSGGPDHARHEDRRHAQGGQVDRRHPGEPGQRDPAGRDSRRGREVRGAVPAFRLVIRPRFPGFPQPQGRFAGPVVDSFPKRPR